MTVIPEGLTAVVPHLGVRNAAEAIDFYVRAFGASEFLRLTEPGGGIAHAELRVAGGAVMLAEEKPEWGNLSPRSLGGSSVRIHLYVDDVDAFVERAAAAGAEIEIPVSDQFYGDRSGRIRDPYGHQWIVATHTEDVPADEMQRRFEAMMAGGEEE